MNLRLPGSASSFHLLPLFLIRINGALGEEDLLVLSLHRLPGNHHLPPSMWPLPLPLPSFKTSGGGNPEVRDYLATMLYTQNYNKIILNANCTLKSYLYIQNCIF